MSPTTDCGNGITAFFSSSSPLSNFHVTNVKHEDGTVYHSSEQMYQHRKPLFHSDTDAASKIEKADTPLEAYKAGSVVKSGASGWYT